MHVFYRVFHWRSNQVSSNGTSSKHEISRGAVRRSQVSWLTLRVTKPLSSASCGSWNIGLDASQVCESRKMSISAHLVTGKCVGSHLLSVKSENKKSASDLSVLWCSCLAWQEWAICVFAPFPCRAQLWGAPCPFRARPNACSSGIGTKNPISYSPWTLSAKPI